MLNMGSGSTTNLARATTGGSAKMAEDELGTGPISSAENNSSTWNNINNPTFQRSPQKSGPGPNNITNDLPDLGDIADFPPLCKTVCTVLPELVEEDKKTTKQGAPSMNWKATASKSLLERHPNWANSYSTISEPNPYTRGLKLIDGEDVTTDELKEVVQDINSSINIEEYKLGDTIQVDKSFFSCRLRHLQSCAFVLCALDHAPSRDKVTEWARNELWQSKGIQVEQIRILARGCFLIVTGSAEQQQNKINGRMIFAFPWDPKFSPRELRSKLVPVWVDLPKVHPMLEAYGAHMLATIGKVLYKTCEMGRDSYMHIRGCVLTDISRKLKDHVKIQIDGVEEPMVQPVWYTSLPNICFACHQRGHIAKDCPAYKEETSQENNEEDQIKSTEKKQGANPKAQTSTTTSQEEDGFTTAYPKSRGGISREEANKVDTQRDSASALHAKSNQEDKGSDEEMGSDIEVHPALEIQGESRVAATTAKDPNAQNQQYPGTNLKDDQLEEVQVFPGEALTGGRSSKAKDKSNAGGNNSQSRLINEVEGKKGTNVLTTKKLQVPTHSRSISIKKAARKGGRNPNRLRVARKWIAENHKEAVVIAFQELKALEENLSFNLKRIWEQGKVVVDYSQSGRGGAALLLHPSLQVLDSGIKGDGSVAWAKIMTVNGPISVMSLYAPNNAAERRPLWSWLSFKTEGENWMIMGDFNSVELPDDTDGPTALLNGGELRTWKACASEVELVDAYLCASFTEGPRFTRQVFSGDRLDQARLDRCYLTNGASWCHHVHKVAHDATQTISDHWPVSVTLTLQEAEREVMRRGSYFKMDSAVLKNSRVLQEVKEAWNMHPPGVTDPQVKWTLGWGRVRAVLSRVRREGRQMMENISEKRTELAAIRFRLQTESSVSLRERALTLEKEIRKGELEDAKSWRLRSRVRWMEEGEAPSHYFFAQLKAKYARESIQFLRRDDLSETTREGEVKEMVQEYFQEQFRCPVPASQDLHLRKEVLRLVDKKVPDEQNRLLRESPTEREIDELVEELPRDKAPGLDGVTNNMVQDCWDLIKSDCYNMLKHFWVTGELLHKNSQGVIKLLPKNEEKWFLKNWRPITLMGITYKLCGKLLAKRLKRVVASLTSPQQTGFIEGRSIFDNLLGSRMGADWVQESEQEAIFLKLDFAKAYDRVRHDFIWDTLEAMKIDTHFISLLKGLTLQGSSKVHINGWFTEEILLDRGVRQGCPVAPYLFVLSTQPLMLLFEKAQREGRLTGIQLPGGRQLLHQLFADDTGVHMQATEECFNTTRAIVYSFERISGAALNLSKSQIIPLGFREVPNWITRTGCKVAEAGEIVVYLGGPIGYGISDGQIVDFLLAKFQKRLGHWSSKMVSWAGRVITLRHILALLPTYHFMTLSLTRHGFQEMEKVCRTFLWGLNPEGNPKKSLVGWEKINNPKTAGGLGLGNFILQADTMKMRLVTRILRREGADWIILMEAILQKQAPGWRMDSDGCFPLQEYLLLGPKPSHKSAITVKWLLSGWYKVRTKLFFSANNATLPYNIALWKLEILMKKLKVPPDISWRTLRAVFRHCEIRILSDLFNRDGRRRILPGFERKLDTCNAEARASFITLEAWISTVRLADTRLEDSNGWVWDSGGHPIRDWHTSNDGWRKLLASTPKDDGPLYLKWPGSGEDLEWQRRWSALWKGQNTERNKLWIWRIYRGAFFTAERGAKMAVCDGLCKRCRQDTEDVTHLFWGCRKCTKRWSDLVAMGLLGLQQLPRERNIQSFLELVDKAVFNQRSHPTWFLTIVVHTRVIWTERNEWIFRKKDSILPATECLREVVRELSVVGNRRGAGDTQSIAREILHLETMSNERSLINTGAEGLEISQQQVTIRSVEAAGPEERSITGADQESRGSRADDLQSGARSVELRTH
ncbi:hypothetical protein R1sor_008575 [Riccia sorocarpa]|uniref:CCHC-type domain-containing protein n=1 Tax=Riccia sorocarpa TaxID=122646 RepID=A0ABD3I025_9MARC